MSSNKSNTQRQARKLANTFDLDYAAVLQVLKDDKDDTQPVRKKSKAGLVATRTIQRDYRELLNALDGSSRMFSEFIFDYPGFSQWKPGEWEFNGGNAFVTYDNIEDDIANFQYIWGSKTEYLDYMKVCPAPLEEIDGEWVAVQEVYPGSVRETKEAVAFWFDTIAFFLFNLQFAKGFVDRNGKVVPFTEPKVKSVLAKLEVSLQMIENSGLGEFSRDFSDVVKAWNEE